MIGWSWDVRLIVTNGYYSVGGRAWCYHTTPLNPTQGCLAVAGDTMLRLPRTTYGMLRRRCMFQFLRLHPFVVPGPIAGATRTLLVR